MILLDTNVLSELIKPAPHERVVDWLRQTEPALAIPTFAIAEMAYGKWLQPQGNRKPFDLRKHYSLNAGLRVYLPLVFGLRVFADASAGASYLHNDLRHQGRTFRAAGYTPSAALAAGLQLRVIESLALGARAKWWFAEDPLADLHKQLGAHERIPFSATGSVTWHF